MSILRTDIERVHAQLDQARGLLGDSAQEAIPILDTALAVAEHHVLHVSRDKSLWKDLRVRILHDRAIKRETAEDTAGAMQDARMAMDLLDSSISNETQTLVRMLYGRCLLELGLLDAALEQFTSLWEGLRVDADPAMVGVIAGNIGTIVFNLRHEEESLGWFQNAADAFSCTIHHDKHAFAIRGIGMAYSKLNRYDEAFAKYANALEVIERIDPPPVRQLLSIRESIGVDYLNVADTTHKQTHYKQALKHFEACLELADQHNLGTAAIVARRNMGLVYAERQFKGHDLTVAREYLEECLRLARESGLRLLEGQVLRDLSTVLEACNDHVQALSTLRDWYRIEREVISARAESRVKELEIQLATERADADRITAEQHNTTLSLEIERQRRNVTAVTMAIGQKNAALHETRNRLRELSDLTSDAEVQKELRTISRRLELAENSDAYWEGLEEQLSEVHAGALDKLYQIHPNLTPTERRVCALIRHDLSTKDIARLLGTEPRSVEKYRQRIRKKLGLVPSANLFTYLTSL